VFAPRTYVSADFTAREAQVYRLESDGAGRPRIASEKQGAPAEEPLRRQIESFATAVRERSRPVVSGEDGRRALALAHAILERMAGS
jgi:predicted dehydrogenase